MAVLRDITDRHELERELEDERRRRHLAEAMLGFGIWELDVGAQRLTMSEGARMLMGREHDAEDRLEHLIADVHDEGRQRLFAALELRETHGVGEHECDVRGSDGRRRRVLMRGLWQLSADGRELITGTAMDITELRAAERRRNETETLLRQGFTESPLGMSLSHPRSGRYLRVNDAFCRLLGRTRQELLELTYLDVSHPADAPEDSARRAALLATASGSFQLQKRYLRPDGSVVWASLHMMPVYGSTGRVSAFFSQVDDITAIKERESRLVREAAERERLAEVRAALEEDRLILHAQPIIDLRSGGVVQQELLVRVRLEDGELMCPPDFLPAAERLGFITEIDKWVTERAVELAAQGQPVEVNLSGASVGDPELLTTIQAALVRTGADPAQIVFEVTETALMADVERGREFATELHRLGCRFALDDFGTGYGTLTYLKHLPADYVKIDMEFVREIAVSEADQRLVRAIVTMVEDLGKQTIAEGVEDAATLECLKAIGVGHAQGFHLGPPVLISTLGGIGRG